MPQSSLAATASSSSAAGGGGGGGGGLYLNAYEVSFPLEENIERPPPYHLNQGQQMMDGMSLKMFVIPKQLMLLLNSLTKN